VVRQEIVGECGHCAVIVVGVYYGYESDEGWSVRPYYEQDGITIYHGDCREILPTLDAGSVDLVLTDPPYGLAERWTGGTWFNRGVYAKDKCRWDQPLDSDVLGAILQVGTRHIIWGAHNYSMPPARCLLIWRKTNAVPTMADAEIAWTDLDMPAKVFDHLCNGWVRVHPTEKPLSLMQWCIQLGQGQLILDPFMGSGTTLRAAKDLGRRAIGIEIEERYCEIAAKRLAQSVLPLCV
jgi:site-specific DNA-methyltransferase (adenine-specific)